MEHRRSSLLIKDFEPSAVRLKRKLHSILNRIHKRESFIDTTTLQYTTLVWEFLFYLILLIIILVISSLTLSTQDIFYTGKCARRLLVNKIDLENVKTVDQFWIYLEQFNKLVFEKVVNVRNTTYLTNLPINTTLYQILFSNENYIIGKPRLRQLRVDETHCRVAKDLSVRPLYCYAPYKKSREYRKSFTTVTSYVYIYTKPKSTDAFKLPGVYGPYDTGGFIVYFESTSQTNIDLIEDLKRTAWLDPGTRAIVIELIYFNPNTDLLTSVNILFEFTTTGAVEVREFIHTVAFEGYFFGRNHVLGTFQILFIVMYLYFAFYYVGKVADDRLWFLWNQYWNIYDLFLLILFTINLFFDIKFLVFIGRAIDALSVPNTPNFDVYKRTLPFIRTQISRISVQAYMTCAIVIRSLKFLSSISYLTGHLLSVFYQSITSSFGFLLLFFLVFMSFVFFGTFHYGTELYEFHTFALTSYTLIRCALGQFDYDRAYRVSPTWTPIYYMLYVCIIFFILLNLFIAIINETYVISKNSELQAKEIELQDELEQYGANEQRQKRPKRPILQDRFIRQINRLLRLFDIDKQFDVNDENLLIGKKDQTNTEKDDEDDDDKQMMGKMDITVKHAILAEQLKTILINDGYNTDVIDEYFKRYRNREDLSILKMDQSKAIKQLQGEFKIFNRQYETLTNDWRKAAIATREVILLNTVEQDQAQTMRTHLDNLDKRFQKLKILVPKALRNAVQLYIDRFAID